MLSTSTQISEGHSKSTPIFVCIKNDAEHLHTTLAGDFYIFMAKKLCVLTLSKCKNSEGHLNKGDGISLILFIYLLRLPQSRGKGDEIKSRTYVPADSHYV